MSSKPVPIQGIEPPPLLEFNIRQYVDAIQNVISSLFNPTKLTYKVNTGGGIKSPDRDLFPYLLDSYLYTLTILTFYFSKRVQPFILKCLHVLEALPDLFFCTSCAINYDLDL